MEWDWYYIPFALCTSIILGLGAENMIKTITPEGNSSLGQKNDRY
jgi:hypothetical protein